MVNDMKVESGTKYPMYPKAKGHEFIEMHKFIDMIEISQKNLGVINTLFIKLENAPKLKAALEEIIAKS